MLIYLALVPGAGSILCRSSKLPGKRFRAGRVRLESEIELLEAENAYLRSRAQELRSRQSEVLHRMQDRLDAWEVQEVEITGYAPLDPRAVPGVCYSVILA